MPKTDVHYIQPSTLMNDLTPIPNYSFRTLDLGEEVEVTMSTKGSVESILTFGIFGRVFRNDGGKIGPRSSATMSYSKTNIFLVLSIILSVLN